MISKIKERIKNDKYTQYLIAYLVIVTVFHIFIREYDSDTVAYYSRASWGEATFGPGALFRLLKYRYESWTSRVVLEAPLFVLTHGMHQIVWSVINIAMHGILYAALNALTDRKHGKQLFILLLLYPIYEMGTAGWITCYIIYWWTLALAAVSLLSLKAMYEDRKVSVIWMMICILCEFYATSLEQFAGLYLGVLVLFTFLMITDHKFTPLRIVFTVLQYAVCIGNIVFALTGPGNRTKEGFSAFYWFPDYSSLTIVDKIVLAVNTTMSFLTEKCILWFVLCTLIFVLVYQRYQNDNVKALVASFPVMITLIRTFMTTAGRAYFPDYMYVFDIYSDAARVDATNYNSLSGYFPFILYMTVVTTLICSLIWICVPDNTENGNVRSTREMWVILYILMLGFAVRGVMGFSPTIYASTQRTFMVTEFVWIYLVLRLYEDKEDVINTIHVRYINICKLVMYGMAVLSVVNNLLTVSNRYYYR